MSYNLCVDELTVSSRKSRSLHASLLWRGDRVIPHAGAAMGALVVATLLPPKKCLQRLTHPSNLPFGPRTINSATPLHHDPLLCDRRQFFDEESAHLRAASAATSEIRMRLHRNIGMASVKIGRHSNITTSFITTTGNRRICVSLDEHDQEGAGRAPIPAYSPSVPMSVGLSLDVEQCVPLRQQGCLWHARKVYIHIRMTSLPVVCIDGA
jgi:hypothetical protein